MRERESWKSACPGSAASYTPQTKPNPTQPTTLLRQGEGDRRTDSHPQRHLHSVLHRKYQRARVLRCVTHNGDHWVWGLGVLWLLRVGVVGWDCLSEAVLSGEVGRKAQGV